MHARTPKNFVLEERLERYADAIELCPRAYAGRWAEACWPLDAVQGVPAAGEAPTARPRARGFERVVLDLGCGKGIFACEAAAAEPTSLFVALDAEPLCIAYAAQHVCEAQLRNVVVVPWDGARVTEVFGPGEVSRIHLNFPTPFPRKKEARKRMTSARQLMAYRRILAPGGTVELRTDSEPLFAFTRVQLQLAGYELLWASDDLRAERPDGPGSEYERKLAAQGAKVHALCAVPGPEPASFEEPAPESLMDYLPDDLTTMDLSYLPHGMAAGIVNFRNRDLRRARKQRRA